MIARGFLANGAKSVTLVDISQERLHETRNELQTLCMDTSKHGIVRM